MTFDVTTNFKDSNNVDLGKKLVTKDYLLTVYPSILDSLGNSGLTVTPALWTWGLNEFGQLGVNDTINRTTPVTTLLGGTNWKYVICGDRHTVALKTDGTLWTWGRNNTGQLGVNDNTTRSTPVTTLLGGNNWKFISTNAAIKTDGTLWTWGIGGGLSGVNDITTRSTPVTTILGGTNWKSVARGFSHYMAIKTDGTLWTWGINSDGQLGVNDTTDRSTPVTTLLGGTNWKSVSGGFVCSLAIKTDGTLWTWGNNSNGELGLGFFDTTDRQTPVTTILGGNNWKSISVLGSSMYAIKTDGTLWTWGTNGSGQLGINNTTSKNTPVTTILGGTNWKSVYEGDANLTAAMKTDGTLWIWGRNTNGQLGVNDTRSRSTPVTTLLGGNNWKSFSCGDGYTAAIQSVDDI